MSRKKKVQPQNENLRAPKMAHIRHIKPEFFTSEKVNDLAPLAALAWIGLWCHADKNGRFEWKPRVLKVLIFPYRDGVDFEKLLHELARAGCVQKYTVNGQDYGLIVNWTQHQYISRREADSKFEYPAPPASPSLHVQERVGTCGNDAVLEGECVGEGEDVGVGQGDGDGRDANKNSTPQTQDPPGTSFRTHAPARTALSDEGRDLWSELSALSEDLADAQRYKGQRELLDHATTCLGLDWVLQKAHQFLKGVRTDGDRKYAAKQFCDSLKEVAEKEYTDWCFREGAAA